MGSQGGKGLRGISGSDWMVFTSRLSHLLIARVYFEATTASMPNVRFAVRGDENGHTPHADSGTCSFVISVGGKGTVKS